MCLSIRKYSRLRILRKMKTKLKLERQGYHKVQSVGWWTVNAICLVQKFPTERALLFLAIEYMKYLIFKVAGKDLKTWEISIVEYVTAKCYTQLGWHVMSLNFYFNTCHTLGSHTQTHVLNIAKKDKILFYFKSKSTKQQQTFIWMASRPWVIFFFMVRP